MKRLINKLEGMKTDKYSNDVKAMDNHGIGLLGGLVTILWLYFNKDSIDALVKDPKAFAMLAVPATLLGWTKFNEILADIKVYWKNSADLKLCKEAKPNEGSIAEKLNKAKINELEAKTDLRNIAQKILPLAESICVMIATWGSIAKGSPRDDNAYLFTAAASLGFVNSLVTLARDLGRMTTSDKCPNYSKITKEFVGKYTEKPSAWKHVDNVANVLLDGFGVGTLSPGLIALGKDDAAFTALFMATIAYSVKLAKEIVVKLTLGLLSDGCTFFCCNKSNVGDKGQYKNIPDEIVNKEFDVK